MSLTVHWSIRRDTCQKDQEMAILATCQAGLGMLDNSVSRIDPTVARKWHQCREQTVKSADEADLIGKLVPPLTF